MKLTRLLFSSFGVFVTVYLVTARVLDCLSSNRNNFIDYSTFDPNIDVDS